MDTKTILCPICHHETCQCLLRDRQYLAQQVGKLLRGGNGSGGISTGLGEDETQEPPERDKDWDQTPPAICRQIIGLVPWSRGELVLEPFRGDGNFFRNLPKYVRKDWCEIKQGRDFFQYEGAPDTIITNPPFRDTAGGDNLVVPCLEKCLQMAKKRVIYFVNHKVFNALTAGRLKKYEDWGWGITHLSVFDVRKWFGRYYLIVWERGKPSIIGHFSANDGTVRRALPLLAGCAVARS